MLRSKILGAALALSFLGATCMPKPADYGDELDACVKNSATAEAFTACCIDVAHKHHRDPSFCVLPEPATDAGIE